MDADECPFAAGHDEVPPRVAGREIAFDAIDQLMTGMATESPSEALVLASLPGGGRTAVLRQAPPLVPDNWKVISVDGVGLAAGAVAGAALDALVADLAADDPDAPAPKLAKAALDSERAAILAGRAEAITNVTAALALAVAVSGRGRMLLVDDLDGQDTAAHDAVIEGLGAGSARGLPLGAVITTIVDPALVGRGRVVDLPPLSLFDLENAVLLPAATLGRPVTTDALQAISLHSEGHPWLIQALMAGSWTPPGEPITGASINQRVPVAQAAYRSAMIDPGLAALSSGAVRYLRAVATADVVTHSSVSQGLGDSNRFGASSDSALGHTRDELRRVGLLRSVDGDTLRLPLPGLRLRLLADL
ncbi:MAG: hypothetical protein GY713_17885 [Actinomycetia bacterium]|nr:hypothetical protein [Actinomycetes bacterium]